MRPTLLTGREKKGVSALSVFFTVLVAVILLLFLFELWFMGRFTPVCVEGTSMEQTLQDGDWLYADAEAEPKRGDVVILYVGDYQNEYGHPLFQDEYGNAISYIIKRVIALEGDELYAYNNVVYRKEAGESEFRPIEETYAYYEPTRGGLYFGSERDPVKVQAGEIFVMGDNRLNSHDSVDVGALNKNSVTGVVPEWAVEHRGAITGIESFRDRFRN